MGSNYSFSDRFLIIKDLNMKRKYCIFAAQYFPHLGGVERYTYNLARKLVEMGNDVTVVTSSIQQAPNYEKMDKIFVYRLPSVGLLEGRYPIVKINRIFRKMHRILVSKKFDFIIVNTRFYMLSVYGQWFAKKQGIRAITIEHGSSHLSVNNKIFDFVGAIYEHALTRVGRLFCQDYYGVSQACVEWLKHFHITGKGVLYNSIDISDVEGIINNSENKYRTTYNIDKDAIVVTFTGRLLPEKGVPQLVEAVKQLNNQNKKVYLFIAGDGDLEEFVNNSKDSNIIPLGRLEFEDVINLLVETDIFCLPSFSEGFSTAILEAIVCKCYVITTERGGARETFPTKEYGSIIKNNNVKLLKEALEKALENPEGRKKAIELSYHRLKDNYTWDIVASQVDALK